MDKSVKQKKVLLAAKVPEDLRKLIESKAMLEERSVSQVVSRLLASHPDLRPKKNLVAA